MNGKIRFAKMHGLGNDFVVIDAVRQNVLLDKKLARKIAHRHLGIGCDQILLVEPPTKPDDDFFYRIFNSNGEEVAQCGNGARCLGRFIHDDGLSQKKELTIGYAKGRMKVIVESHQVTALLGPPSFEPKAIPIKALRQKQGHRYAIKVNQQMKEVSALTLGNPHCVIDVPSAREAKVAEIGKSLQNKNLFPQGVNVGFMQILARNHIQLRVYERGVGETFACGTGACAAVISGILNGALGQEVKVDMRGGHVFVSWPDQKGPVYLSGETTRVFNGIMVLKEAQVN